MNRNSILRDEALRAQRKRLADWAGEHPAAAERIGVGREGIADPQLKLLLEAFTGLVAEARQLFEDGLSSATAQTLELVAPHLARDVPPMAVVQFKPTEKRGIVVSAGSVMRPEAALDESPLAECAFTLPLPCVVVPFQISAATYGVDLPRELQARLAPSVARRTRAFVRFDVEPTSAMAWNERDRKLLRALRLYLAAPDDAHSAGLYEALFARGTVMVATCGDARQHRLAVRSGGLRRRDLLLPVERTLPSRQAVFEYFAFPQKRRFVEISRLEEATLGAKAPPRITVYALLDAPRPELAGLSACDVLLNCAPVVNLFNAKVRPVTPTADRTEYALQPGAMHTREVRVRTIRRVWEVDRTSGRRTQAPWLFGDDQADSRYAWTTRRDEGDIHGTAPMCLSIVDRAFDPHAASGQLQLLPEVECSTPELAAKLGPGRKLKLDEPPADGLGAVLLVRPTTLLMPPPAAAQARQLPLHWTVNRGQFMSPKAAAVRLRQMLELFLPAGAPPNADESPSAGRTAEARASVAAIREVETIRVPGKVDRCRVVLDAAAFAGGYTAAFAQLLRRFIRAGRELHSSPSINVKIVTVGSQAGVGDKEAEHVR